MTIIYFGSLLILLPHLRAGLQGGVFLCNSPTKILYALFTSDTHIVYRDPIKICIWNINSYRKSYVQKFNTLLIKVHYFIRQFTLLFTHIVSYDDRHSSARSYSNQQWVGTHHYKFNTVQLIFGLSRHIYIMWRAKFSFGSQTRAASKKYFVHCMCKFVS